MGEKNEGNGDLDRSGHKSKERGKLRAAVRVEHGARQRREDENK